MNKVILMGRLARDPEVRYTSGQDTLAIARFTLAVERRMKREDQINADFISCVSFGRQAEFVEKYFHQGLKIAITGRIQTGSYKNREGQTIYTTEVVVEEQEFAESKAASEAAGNAAVQNKGGSSSSPSRSTTRSKSKPSSAPSPTDAFMDVADTIDEDLPFN